MVNPTTLPSPLAKGQEVRNPEIGYDPTLKILTINGTQVPLGDAVSYDADTGMLTINTTHVQLTPDPSELDDGTYQLTVSSGVLSWTSV